MAKAETFVENLLLLRRENGIESLRGSEDRLLLGDMLFRKCQHFFQTLRCRQVLQRLKILAFFFPTFTVPFYLIRPFSPCSLLARGEFEIGFKRFQPLFLSFLPVFAFFRLPCGRCLFARGSMLSRL